MIKVLNVVGARPQFIKYFPVGRAIEGGSGCGAGSVRDILVHTGQHYDYRMSKIFFDEFGIREPDYHLEVGSGTHGQQTAQVIRKTEEVIGKETPDAVIVYGDTNSTLGAALAASKLHVPVIHIEAGLRSFNKFMPEEINRILTDHVSALLLCPSVTAVNNLRIEGFRNIVNNGDLVMSGCDSPGLDMNNPAVMNTGDVMFDAVLHAAEIAEKKSRILDELGLTRGEFCLLTMHRAENTDDIMVLENMIGFVNDVTKGRSVVFPMHPRTRKVYEKAKKRFDDNVQIIEPLGYFDLLMTLKNSALVLTDSGGMQKEAFWLEIPCITLRDETEWVETVETGWNVLYKNYRGTHPERDTKEAPYGDGKAAERVARVLQPVKYHETEW